MLTSWHYAQIGASLEQCTHQIGRIKKKGRNHSDLLLFKWDERKSEKA